MTPAEYAKAQGWRVGDLVLGDSISAKGVYAIVRILSFEGACVFGCLQDPWPPRRYVFDVTGYKRIGRVLRPNGGR